MHLAGCSVRFHYIKMKDAEMIEETEEHQNEIDNNEDDYTVSIVPPNKKAKLQKVCV